MKIKATRECKACFVRHMGAWAIVPEILEHSLAEYVDGRLPAAFLPGEDIPDGVGVEVVDRTAIIDLSGAMMKGRSKFGGTFSTVDARGHVRAVRDDREIDAALVRIDSPGGHVEGVAELAADIDALARTKPTHVFGEDLMASAGYWIAAGANRITANDMAQVGSIGVFAIMYDQSEKFDKRGIKVHRLATGDLKGVGAEGTEITGGALEETREIVEHYGERFFSRVTSFRNIESAAMAEIKRGGVFTAAKAKSFGLIDDISTFESAFDAVREAGAKRRGRERLARGY